MSDIKNSKGKFYDLMMFPYPSGTAMHVGHASNYLYSEITARFRRMQGYDVIFPLGYDSFGLPTENFAIKNNVSAKEATDNNIKYFEEQVAAMNFSLDKDRMLLTSNPDYYKWTQWIFAKLFEHGLVYRKDGFVNWCNGCQTVLANDQIVDGRCERCETEIIQKKQPQRYIKITDYAEHLLDYSDCYRPEETKLHQKNRIGKSQGAEIDFAIEGSDKKITVFTTRPDTIYGVTAVVLAPENDILDSLLGSEYISNLQKYRAEVAKETNITRQAEGREKTGIFSGIYVLHPLTGEKVAVRYADYVLPDYATGSVMMVPAHDIRDWDFAHKFGVAIKDVIKGEEESALPYTGKGVLINSGSFDGMDNISAKNTIIEHLEATNNGNKKITYRLRDWSVSRQRYRGSPIPVYYTFPENEKVPYFANKAGLGLVEGMPIVSRKVAKAAIKHRSEDKYLLIKSDKLDWHFVAGGVDEGETWDQAAIRESREETPFTNFEVIKHINSQAHSCFYNPNKKENRYLVEELSILQLLNDERSASENLESDGYIFERVSPEEVGNRLAYSNEVYNRYKYYDPSKVVDVPEYVDKYNANNPHPDKSKWIPNLIPDDQLPVILPLDLPNYKPAGKSPLEDHPTFKYYHSSDGNIYLRECDTLDTFMCSSFYYLRFLDPQNSNELISAEAQKNMPVDLYIGGKEHTVGHLLYSRFIYKFLHDKGYINNPSKEPFRKLVHQGMVSASDGRKMSKRRGNVIDPMDTIRQYGADTLRTYIMFMGPIEINKNRNPEAVAGISKFLARVVRASELIDNSLSARDDLVSSAAHIAIRGVSEDLENLKFNTAVSKLMILVNSIYDTGKVSKENFENLLLLLSPFATETSQELWAKIGHSTQIASQGRPEYKSEYVANMKINLAVQINGKTRGTVEVDSGITQDQVIDIIKSSEQFDKYLVGEIRKIIYVQDKICNLIVG